MEKQRTVVQLAIEEKFRQMVEKSKSNAKLKQEVMCTVDRINNVATLVDLFTVKMFNTETSFFNSRSTDIVKNK